MLLLLLLLLATEMENLHHLSLQLDEETSFEDSLADFESTYRAKTQFGEDVSVSADRVRFEGKTVEMLDCVRS